MRRTGPAYKHTALFLWREWHIPAWHFGNFWNYFMNMSNLLPMCFRLQNSQRWKTHDFCAAGDQNLKKGTSWFSVVQGTLDLVSQDNQRPMMLSQTGVQFLSTRLFRILEPHFCTPRGYSSPRQRGQQVLLPPHGHTEHWDEESLLFPGNTYLLHPSLVAHRVWSLLLSVL